MKLSVVSLPRAAVLSIGLILLGSSTAAAQTPAASLAPAPKVDVFGGIGIWQEEGSTWSGFHLSGAVRPWRHVGFVGDVAFWSEADGYKPPATVMGGVRFYIPIQRVTLFAQVLAGQAPLDDFALQPGGGLDVHLNRHVAIRAAGDVKVSGDDGSTFIGYRISTGVVIAFGGK